MNTIQEQIEKMKADGYKFGFHQNGVSIGPECDHCGKTGINLVLVYATKDNLDDADPVADCVFTFGSGCIKKYKF